MAPPREWKMEIGGWGRTKKGKKDLAASAFGVEVNKEQGSYPTVLRYLPYLTLPYFILNQPKLIYSMIAYFISFIFLFPIYYACIERIIFYFNQSALAPHLSFTVMLGYE